MVYCQLKSACPLFRFVSQEHITHNDGVPGSNTGVATIFFINSNDLERLLEFLLSNPLLGLRQGYALGIIH
jgi:hypothetical protein